MELKKRKKRTNKQGKVTYQMFSVQMVFCHKRGLVRPSLSIQLLVPPDHWSPEEDTHHQGPAAFTNTHLRPLIFTSKTTDIYI